MKIDKLAEEISKYLYRFERDMSINVKDPIYKTHPFYYAHASKAGSRVRLQYVVYQGSSTVSKAEALWYLIWLEEGNVGTHWDADRARNARDVQNLSTTRSGGD